jgi:hypothetical protein
MTFTFDEDNFEKEFFSKYKKGDDISLFLYTFSEEFSSKKSLVHNKKLVKYYYGTTDNAIKVFEKSWKLDYNKDCLSKGIKIAYNELAGITLYHVFYRRLISQIIDIE